MKRTIAIAAALVGLVVLVPTAAASDTSDTTTAPPSNTSTSTTTTVPTTTTTTEVPVTTTTTSTPTTSTPTTSTPTTTTTVPTTTTTTSIPTTADEGPCMQGCIPTAEPCEGPECIPSAGGAYPTAVAGAGSLPFTGIEDMIAPILLALTVVLGGVVAWRWARLRESVAEAAQRARPLAARETRTGYATAARNFGIEQRARQMFTPRVA